MLWISWPLKKKKPTPRHLQQLGLEAIERDASSTTLREGQVRTFDTVAVFGNVLLSVDAVSVSTTLTLHD